MTKGAQAVDPNTPPEVLADIIGDVRRIFAWDEWNMCMGAAGNPNLPVRVMEDIALHGDKNLKCGLANNPRLTQTVFEVLMQDKDVHPDLVWNKNIPLHFLVYVARSTYPTPDAHRNVAGKAQTPSSVLVELALHPDILVRCHVAQNPNTPEWLRWVLSCDEVDQVRLFLYFCNISDELRMHILRHENSMANLKDFMEYPHTPPLVKVWWNSDYRDTMSLEEFLEATK